MDEAKESRNEKKQGQTELLNKAYSDFITLYSNNDLDNLTLHALNIIGEFEDDELRKKQFDIIHSHLQNMKIHKYEVRTRERVDELVDALRLAVLSIE